MSAPTFIDGLWLGLLSAGLFLSLGIAIGYKLGVKDGKTAGTSQENQHVER